MAESHCHVLQDTGRNSAVIHDKRDLDKLPRQGQRMTIAYENGRGTVSERQANTRDTSNTR